MSGDTAPPQRRSVCVGWDEVERHTRALARHLRAHGPWVAIVAVARGGLVPAAILARELDLHLVDTACIASYDEMNRGMPRILKGIEGPGAGLLVVDDIADTGHTARIVRAMLPQAYLATVFAKPAGRPLVDTCAVTVGQEVWIVFPWEIQPPSEGAA